MVGNFGFTSNRFDNLYINKQILTAGGSVQLTDTSGRIPDLSSTYFSLVPGIFSRIGNASLVEQFLATSTSDLLSFAGSGGTSVSFNAALKKITISSTASDLFSVLTQGSDASTFTGTTKIGGILSLGSFASSTASILTANQTGSGLIADFQQSGSSRFSVATNGNVTIAGRLITGSGAVNLTNDAGKIPALSSTYFADLSGANLTSLNATNITSGTLAVTVGGTGLTSYAAGDLLYASATTTLSRLAIGTANTILTSSGSLPQWSTSLTLAGTLSITASSTNTLLVNNTATQSLTNAIADFQNNGTSRLYIASNGNVGIGSTSPTADLHVNASTTQTMLLANKPGGAGALLDIQKAGASQLYVSNVGNVGIGTSSPSSLFSVGLNSLFQVTSQGFALLPNGTSTTPSLAFSADTTTGLFSQGTGILAFGTAGAERMRIDSSGNLGIGVTLPGARLHVKQTTNTFNSALVVERGGAPSAQGALYMGADNQLYLQAGSAAGGYITIQQGGNVGIGTATPGSKLTVAGTIESTSGGVKFPDASTQTVAYGGAPASATVATQETTTSTSYTDLATVGPAVTVTVSSTGKALVIITASASNNTNGIGNLTGVAVSGATTRAVAESTSLSWQLTGAVQLNIRASAAFLFTGLTAGSNTFTLKYKVDSASTGTWQDRSIIVFPY